MAIEESDGLETDLGRFDVPKTPNELYELQRRTTQLRQAHLVKWAERKLCPPHATPVERQAILERFRTREERIAAAGVAADVTLSKYRGQGRQAFQKSLTDGVSVWEWGAARYSTTGSWYTFRAAMQFFLVEEISIAKRTLDEWLRVGRPGQEAPAILVQAAKRAMHLLPRLANELAALPNGLPEAFRVGSSRQSTPPPANHVPGVVMKPKRRRRSKSASLKRLPPDWREQMAAKMSPGLRLQWLMQCVTGCRSEELKKGVTVTMRRDGRLQTSVNGAKTGKRAGQPTREMVILAMDGVARELAKFLQPEKPVTSKFRAIDVDAYRKAVTRVGERLFLTKESAERVTPYSARNQFKADITKAGLSRQQIAQAMGHSTTRSAVYYGRGVRSRGDGSVTPIAVSAARSVKMRAAIPQHVKRRKRLKTTFDCSRVAGKPKPRR